MTLVIFEFPAELVSLNVMLPGCAAVDIVMIELPAVLELLNVRDVSARLITELLAVLELLKVIVPPRAAALIFALPAELVSLNVRVAEPVRLMAAPPAVEELLKDVIEPAAALIVALPAVLELLNCSDPLLPMVAVLAVAVLLKVNVPGIGNNGAARGGALEEIHLHIIGDVSASRRAGVVELQNAVVDDRRVAGRAGILKDNKSLFVVDCNGAGAAARRTGVLEDQIAGRNVEGLRIGGVVDDPRRVDDERIVDIESIGLRIGRGGELDRADRNDAVVVGDSRGAGIGKGGGPVRYSRIGCPVSAINPFAGTADPGAVNGMCGYDPESGGRQQYRKRLPRNRTQFPSSIRIADFRVDHGAFLNSHRKRNPTRLQCVACRDSDDRDCVLFSDPPEKIGRSERPFLRYSHGLAARCNEPDILLPENGPEPAWYFGSRVRLATI